MLNKLNKSVTNKQLFGLCCQRFRCLRTRSTSEPTKESETDVPNRRRTQNVDYLSIFDITSEDIAGTRDRTYDGQQSVGKYEELVEGRTVKMSDEKYMTTSFGRVRLDSDNRPKIHGHYDPTNQRLRFDVAEFEEKLKTVPMPTAESHKEKSGDHNIFEDQYFDSLKSDGTDVKPRVVDNFPEDTEEYNFIDRQYFVDNPNVEPLFKSKIKFKFNQDMKHFVEEETAEQRSVDKPDVRRRQIHDKRDMNTKEEVITREPIDVKKISIESPLKSELFFDKFDEYPTKDETKTDDYDLEFEISKKIEEQKDIKLEEVESSADKYSRPERTGAQYLEDIQSGKESPQSKLFTPEVKKFRSAMGLRGDKLDSKGFRVLSGQVIDFSKLTNDDICQLLMKSILFNDVDIVAINKPYGMSVHTKESKGNPVLTEFLPQLCRRLDCQDLYTVHRLDRDTTGILLLAKSQQRAKALNQLFADRRVIKRYFCITRGVPDKPEGVIDIPIELGHCGGVERMVLRPEALEAKQFEGKLKSSRSAKRAVTQYKVISFEGNAALLEVWPQTGVRHQIRVHLGFGLRCPILGDHKYSHLEKIAPQKLTTDMLLKLNVRQAKVRHVPMHLHARQYCLTGAGADGRNIFINAPFPHHFNENMSRLRLSLTR